MRCQTTKKQRLMILQYADDITLLIALPDPPPVVVNNNVNAITQINIIMWNQLEIQYNMNKIKIMNIFQRNTSLSPI